MSCHAFGAKLFVATLRRHRRERSSQALEMAQCLASETGAGLSVFGQACKSDFRVRRGFNLHLTFSLARFTLSPSSRFAARLSSSIWIRANPAMPFRLATPTFMRVSLLYFASPPQAVFYIEAKCDECNRMAAGPGKLLQPSWMNMFLTMLQHTHSHNCSYLLIEGPPSYA